MTPATLLDVPLQPGVDAAEGGATLDDVIVGVWETLAADRVAPCPVCGAAMQARFGAHARPVDGRCGSCGATLA